MKRLLVNAAVSQQELDNHMRDYHVRTNTKPDRVDYIENNKIVRSVYIKRENQDEEDRS